MESDTTVMFGMALRHYRIQANMSQATLAERAGLSTATINTLERGVHQLPRMETVRLLAEALGLDAAQREHLSTAARYVTPPPTIQPRVAQTPTNVPRPLTHLIGRTADIVALCDWLRQTTTRLLTLVGPPGVGKTRLGIEVATQMHTEFPDGVFLITLATIQEPSLLLPTIAQTLGQREIPGIPLRQSLCDYLRQRRLLLCLDNFEHLVVAGPIIADILGQCPHIVALVTSRAPLHIHGEQEYAVTPLDVPEVAMATELSAIQQSSAVRLFVQRAKAIKPDFALTNETASTIAAICQRLDGLPLAIELAAARVKTLPVDYLRTRLANPLKLLTGGSQDMPAHQQTLRTTLAWSYNLLTPYAQRIFRHLAIFAGGATLTAIASVLNEGEDELVDGIAYLIDQSLVLPQTQQGEARFDCLVTIREYGREMLVQSGEFPLLQQRHADYYLALAEATAPQLTGNDQIPWLDRVENDQGNYRAVLTYLHSTGAYSAGLRLSIALWAFWQRRGYFTEGRQWFTAFVAMSAASDDDDVIAKRAEALLAIGSLTWRQGDYEHTQSVLLESLDINRRLGHTRGIADALNMLGIVAIYRGEVVAARRLLEESLALRRTLNDPAGLARTLNNLGGMAQERGDDELGQQLLEESLVLFREVGNISAAATVLNNLGGVAVRRHDYAQAHHLYIESLALQQELGDASGVAVAYENLGELAYLQAEYASASRFYTDSLALRRQLGDKQGIVESLRDLGTLALATGASDEALAHMQASLLLAHEMGEMSGIVAGLEMIARIAVVWGHYDRALALLATSATVRRVNNLPAPQLDDMRVTKDIETIQAQIGAAAYQQAWAQGEAWTIESALQVARLLTH